MGGEVQLNEFWRLHSGLDREGPGSEESTRRALGLAGDLGAAPTVLDLGCGPGAQSVTLALALPDAQITAVDLHEDFVAHVRRRAAGAGVADRVRAVVGDMADVAQLAGLAGGATEPTAGNQVYDLVWSEGAAYILGFERALREWRALLAEGGVLALSEPVWLAPGVPRPIGEFWESSYPDIQTAQTRRAQILAAGYHRIGDFTLPRGDWDAYYDPLRSRMAELRGDPTVASVIAAHDKELAVFNGGGAAAVGYQFFVMRVLGP
ncbi:MAG: SAM-dependent methyltransferase [Euzebya sp.]